MFYNLNAGDATKWLYAPDPSQPAFSDRTWENVSGRLTWQATPRNKIGGFWDEQWVCRNCEGHDVGHHRLRRASRPRPIGVGSTQPLRVPQVTWSSPVTNRLLLDAGFGGTYYGWGNFERDPNPTRDLIRVTEQCAAGCATNGDIPGLVYRSQDCGDNRTRLVHVEADRLSYVTGAHSMKVGYQGTLMTDDRTWYHQQPEPDVPLQQRRSESADADASRRDQRRSRADGMRSSPRSSGRSDA